MQLNKREVSDGIKWMFCAGAFALALTAFLVYSDYYLRHSSREKVLGETLHELRTAQTSLGTGMIDERQLHLGVDHADDMTSTHGEATHKPQSATHKTETDSH